MYKVNRKTAGAKEERNAAHKRDIMYKVRMYNVQGEYKERGAKEERNATHRYAAHKRDVMYKVRMYKVQRK